VERFEVRIVTFGSIKACENWKIGAHDYACLIVKGPQNFFIWIARTQEQPQTTQKNLNNERSNQSNEFSLKLPKPARCGIKITCKGTYREGQERQHI